MADNVVKFRKIEKKADPKGSQQRPQGEPKLPAWLPWVLLVVIAVALTLLSFSTPANGTMRSSWKPSS